MAKSSGHVLAIVSNISGHGKAIAELDAIPSIVKSMKLHLGYKDVPKVCIVILLRVFNEAQISHQLLDEQCGEVIFELLGQHKMKEDTVAAMCHILYELTEYASQKEFHLQLYLSECTPEPLLQILRTSKSNVNLVRTIFRIFANIAKSIAPLEHFISMATIEPLLDVLMHSKVSDITESVAACIGALSHDQLSLIRYPDTTLPALLLCLRRKLSTNVKVIEHAFQMCHQVLQKKSVWTPAFAVVMEGYIRTGLCHLRHSFSISLSALAISNNSSAGGSLDANGKDISAVLEFLSTTVQVVQGNALVKSMDCATILQLMWSDLKPNLTIVSLIEFILAELHEQGSGSNPGEPYEGNKINSSLPSPNNNEEEEADDDSDNEGDEDAVADDDEPPKSVVEVTSTLMPKQESSSKELKELEFSFIDTKGRYLPKHPMHNFSHPNPTPSCEPMTGPLLLMESPLSPEPCYAAESSRIQEIIRDAQFRQRQVYAQLQTPTTSAPPLAQIVYDETCVAGSTIKSRVTSPLPYALYNAMPLAAFHDTPALTFTSEFESGNLLRAIRVNVYEYDLVLRADVHSAGNMQWFYFAVSNVTQAHRYRFNIVNCCKPDSQFNHGLRPVVYSCLDARTKGVGWRRKGDDVCYYINPFPKRVGNGKLGETHYSLSFTLELDRPAENTYLIAHSYPYTLTDHRLHMNALLTQPDVAQRCQRQTLCTTLANNACDLLTITDFTSSRCEQVKRKVIVFSSRVHPGEAMASWMMRGMIDFLLSGHAVAKALRRLFVFQIIPILNPDGVFVGNNRCSLSGVDLNRQWQHPHRAVHPTIYHLKTLLRTEQRTRGVVLYVDLHGHSRKKNIFMYGCEHKKRPSPRVREFPQRLGLNDIGKRYVSFGDCSFNLSKGRESTARAVVAQELGVVHSYTLESSFCGPDFGPLRNTHFSIEHLLDVGRALCHTIWECTVPDVALRDHVLEQMLDPSQHIEGGFDLFAELEASHLSSQSLFGPMPSSSVSSFGLASSRSSSPLFNANAPASASRMPNNLMAKSKRKKRPVTKSSSTDAGVVFFGGKVLGETPLERSSTARQLMPGQRHVLMSAQDRLDQFIQKETSLDLHEQPQYHRRVKTAAKGIYRSGMLKASGRKSSGTLQVPKRNVEGYAHHHRTSESMASHRAVTAASGASRSRFVIRYLGFK